jgi:hypothetical protein
MADDRSRVSENFPAPALGDAAPSHPEQMELFPRALISQLAEIERLRIESADKRTQLGLEAIKATDAADQRQFNFHMERLKREDDDRCRRHALAKGIFSVGGVVLTALASLLLGMIFWGTPDQSGKAYTLIKEAAKALGGGGFIVLLIQAVRWLLRRQ